MPTGTLHGPSEERKRPRGREMGRFDAIPRPRKPSMRASINRMCKACIYDPIGGSGTWREQVKGCTVVNCPLWELRPVSQTKEN